MARCPNCGSSVRTGAKFCTTCGFRLPAETTTDQGSTTSRSPFDTTSTSTVSARWPPAEPEPAPAPMEPISDEQTSDETVAMTDTLVPDAEATQSEGEVQPAEAAPFTGWPAYGSPPESESAGDRPATDDAGALAVDEDGDQQAVEDAIASWSSDSDEAPASGSETLTAPVEEDLSAYAWLEPNDEPEPSVVDQAESSPEAASYQFEAVAAVTAELSDEPIAPVELGDVQPVPATADAAIAGGRAGDPLARATQLIDELRELIPQIPTNDGVSSSSTLAVAAELERVRAEDAPESEAFQSLRAAVATAQARPRDVDIMLDLVSRAGAIAEVIGAYDRYQTAIDAAVKALRGETTEDPAPRW